LIALTDSGVATHAATAGVFFTQTRPLATALGPDEQRQRLSLQRLDAALRQVSGLDPRPYAISATAPTTSPATGATPTPSPANGAAPSINPAAGAAPETSSAAPEVGAGEPAEAAGDAGSQLSYSGPTLRPDEEDSVRSYIDFVRSQRK
jgi:hypothetical protein